RLFFVKSKFYRTIFPNKRKSKFLCCSEFDKIKVKVRIFSFKLEFSTLDFCRIHFYKSGTFLNSVDINHSSIVKAFHITTNCITLFVAGHKKSGGKSKSKNFYHLITYILFGVNL